jgi:hypothetical protein
MPHKDPSTKLAYQRRWYLKHRETELIRKREANSRRDFSKGAADRRAYVAANPEKIREERRIRVVKNRKYIQSQKDVPCMDCGIKYPFYVMQFDHVRGKKMFALSNGVRKSREVIDEEIAKCDVVCANCHMERTHGTRRLPKLSEEFLDASILF